MADIDLKTETPDTTLPATGFLFGADSQASASPSVYSTQAVATTLLGSTTLSGTTITANAPVVDFAQTWNNAAVTFTGAKLNITDTASNAASLLMDLQVGGSSQASIDKRGTFTFAAPASGTAPSRPGVGNWFGNLALFGSSGTLAATISSTIINFGTTYQLAWNSDLLLTRRGAANLRLGAADAAAPVAQTLSVQSVVAGTTNTAGTNLTITGSQGTGTGAGGSLIFQVAPAGSSGTAQNALATALTINSAQQLLIGSGAVGAPSIAFSGSTNTGIWSTGTSNISFSTGGTERFRMGSGGAFTSVGGIQFGQNVGSPFSAMTSSAASVILISNQAQNDFNRLQFGGTTSSFPALKRSSASLIVRLADDTANAALESASLKTDAPTGGTAATWKLGAVATVTPTLQNRTIEVDIGGTIYYISAKTTND